MVEPRVWEVVCIHEEGKPQFKWRLGRVIAIIAGKDGITRGAKVWFGESNKRSAVIRRSLQKFYPLEVNDDDKDQQMMEASCNGPDISKTQSENKGLRVSKGKRQANLGKDLKVEQIGRTKIKRPIRKAAIKGQNKRRLNDF